MNKNTTSSTSTVNISALSGDRLWDEIFKAIVDTMPEQLFPLFREVFGKEYPPAPPSGCLQQNILPTRMSRKNPLLPI